MDPRLKAGVEAAYGGDAAAAQAALGRRCRQLLEGYATSLGGDLRFLCAQAGEVEEQEHALEALRRHYSTVGGPDPVLQVRPEGEEPCDAKAVEPAVLLAVTYRAYKKMILADFLFRGQSNYGVKR